MGDFGNGFSGGDLNGNGRFDGGDYGYGKISSTVQKVDTAVADWGR